MKNPGDPHRERQSPEFTSLSSDLAYLAEAVAMPMPRDNPDGILDVISERRPRLRLMYEAAIAYLRGDFALAKRCFLDIGEDGAAKLLACPLAIATAVSLGDYTFYMEVETYLKNLVKADMGADISVLAESALATAYLSAMAPNMAPGWLKDGNFFALPPRVRLDAIYKRTRYFQCLGKYESMLAVAQTALAFYASKQEVSNDNIYLRLMCAVACCALGRLDDAEGYLLDVMRDYLPHGFITPFAELMTVLGGLVEQCLEREFPTYYKPIKEQWDRTVTNWISFHNSFTGDNVMFVLTPREFEIARLVAGGVPYKKIAEQFNMSIGTLNNIMLVIYETLFISGKNRRQELAKYIL